MNKTITYILLCFFAFLLLGTGTVFAESGNFVESKIVSLGVFKNGVILVQEEIPISSTGEFLLKSPPSPIHGTFFVEGDAQFTATLTEREREIPLLEAKSLNLGDDLLGKKLTVRLGEERFNAEIVRHFTLEKNVNSIMSNAYLSYVREPLVLESTPFTVVLRKETGELLFLRSLNDLQEIQLAAEEKLETVRRKEAVLAFHVTAIPEGKKAGENGDGKETQTAVLRLFYLTRGMAWMPNYQAEIHDSRSLTLRQFATLKNEWRDLQNVPTSFISGFPQIEFQNARSPMSPNVSLQAFFQSLSRSSSRSSGSSVVTQQMIMSNSISSGNYEMPATPEMSEGENMDFNMQFQEVGLMSLKAGDTIQMKLAEGRAEYKRIVCWNVEGAIQRDYHRRNENEYGKMSQGKYGAALKDCTEPWDFLQFQNPFSFPMTTAPMSVTGNGRFFAQNISGWANSGEKVFTPVNKAFGIRVSASETSPNLQARMRNAGPNTEEFPYQWTEDGRELTQTDVQRIYHKYNVGMPVRFNNNTYHGRLVNTELEMTNIKNEEVEMLVRQLIVGDFIPELYPETDAQPEVNMLPQKNGVNNVHELVWRVTLQPGETRRIQFSYRFYTN
ncbi:MAG: hypothetical protein Q4C70_08130 [Planctomycetia bacterium]|nr:hypothetical protein [Planctomycetia bacterium]